MKEASGRVDSGAWVVWKEDEWDGEEFRWVRGDELKVESLASYVPGIQKSDWTEVVSAVVERRVATASVRLRV